MKQGAGEAVYEVFVKEVLVGTLTADECAEIKRQALRDPRLYVAQALNIVSVVTKIFASFVSRAPMLAFWSFLGCAYFYPDTCAALFAVVKQGPDAIKGMASLYFTLLVWLWITLTIAEMTFMGRVIGFRNSFDAGIARLVRMKLKVANTGDVRLVARPAIGSASAGATL